MTAIAVMGAGAFGTALAISLSEAAQSVTLWGRDAGTMQAMEAARSNPRLPGVALPASLALTSRAQGVAGAKVVLLAVPTQALAGFLETHRDVLTGKKLVACCKGVDIASGNGPSALIAHHVPNATPAILTGPSFAADIAQHLPTALTLACADGAAAAALQSQLSTPNLRLYRTDDLIGAELGGALKNVVAIAAGVVMGAGLGVSARAALLTRGFAEMQRFAINAGAKRETLSGLSGLGDLVLTCTSDQSRNYRFGMALGRGDDFDPTITVEGATTAQAMVPLARARSVDMPLTTMVAALIQQKCTIREAVDALFSRPLKEE